MSLQYRTRSWQQNVEAMSGHTQRILEKYGERTVALMLVGSFYEMYAVYNETIQVGPDLKLFADILNVRINSKDKKDKKKRRICYSDPPIVRITKKNFESIKIYY